MVQDEGNKVKTHCQISLSYLHYLAAGAIWQEWDPRGKFSRGVVFYDFGRDFKIFIMRR